MSVTSSGGTSVGLAYEVILAFCNRQFDFPGDISVTLPKDAGAAVVVAKENLLAAYPT